MTLRTSLVIAFILLSLVSLLPGVFAPPTGPQKGLRDLAEWSVKFKGGDPARDLEAVDRQYESFVRSVWVDWSVNVATFLFSVVAVMLAWKQKRLGIWLILGISLYLAATVIPYLIRVAIYGNFVSFVRVFAESTYRDFGPIALHHFWNTILAPWAYAITAVGAGYWLFATRKRFLKR